MLKKLKLEQAINVHSPINGIVYSGKVSLH
jgi:hypothetical protein